MRNKRGDMGLLKPCTRGKARPGGQNSWLTWGWVLGVGAGAVGCRYCVMGCGYPLALPFHGCTSREWWHARAEPGDSGSHCAPHALGRALESAVSNSRVQQLLSTQAPLHSSHSGSGCQMVLLGPSTGDCG